MPMRFVLVLLLSLGFFTNADARCRGKDLMLRTSAEFQAAVAKAALKHPFAEGIYWEISRKGKISWIIGTMHIVDKRVSRVPKFFKAKIRQARMVYLETTDKQDQEVADKIEARAPEVEISKDKRDWALFTPSEKKILTAEARRKGFPKRYLPYLKLDSIWNLISGLKCDSSGRDFLDVNIERAANKARVPVQGLDDVDKIVTLFLRDTTNEKTLLQMIKLELPRLGLRRHKVETSVQFYRRGETMKYWEYEKAMARSYMPKRLAAKVAREFSDHLINTRNKLWMTELVPALKKGNVVVGFGSAHLGGRGGVLNLLKTRGFQVKRLVF
ncbi:MAG: TraB/GumN family protein [Rhodobacteraceae bacterium]|nr:TraB/GumN family protein [Paracoccaceae bacterium]